MGDILQERNIRTSDFEGNPIFSLTIEDGVTPKTDRYERTSLITKTEDLFKIVSPNEFVTNPMNLRFGAFGYNKNSFSVCVSGYYDVFSIDNDKCSGFWSSYFKTPIALKRFDDAATGSLIEKRRVKFSTLCQLVFLMPEEMKEKKQIAAFFDCLDSLITLHQRKYDKLCVLKKSMLDKMFPKGGSLYPEIRFAGFTDPWEQRKLGQHLKLSRELGHTGVDARKLTVKLWGKGVVEKTDLYGGSAQTQYYIRHAGQFMYGKLDFLHAAFGVVPDKLDCFESTLDSPAFDIEGLDSSFLLNLVTQEDFYLKNGNIANGSRKAKRIHEETFLNMEIRAPELVEQRRIGAFFDRLDSLITLHQRKLELLRNIKKSMLDKMFV